MRRIAAPATKTEVAKLAQVGYNVIAMVEQGDPHVPIGDYLNIMNALIGLDKTGRKTEFDAWSLLSSGDPLR